MTESEALAEQFEEHRDRLAQVAYRMLGSANEADDAVQEAWLRLSRSDASAVANLGGWLTTVVARVCLDALRTRRARREEPLDGFPGPIVQLDVSLDEGPEEEALLADSVGVALLVVLETLTPAERLAFVLHDMFAVPFEEIAEILERTPAAARQLASRARRRVRGGAPSSDADLARQRQLVDAFLAAARHGDFEALVAVLDPDVVFRVNRGPAVAHGAENVARRVLERAPRFAALGRVGLVNGSAGVLVGKPERPISVVAFTVAPGGIASIHIVTDLGKVRILNAG